MSSTSARIRSRTATTPSAAPTVSAASSQKAMTLPASSNYASPSGCSGGTPCLPLAARDQHVQQRQRQQELPGERHQLVDPQPRQSAPHPDEQEEHQVQL